MKNCIKEGSILAKVLNMFREFTMKRIEGYKKLSNRQKDMFDQIYKKHLSSMSFEERRKYTESCIEKVEGEVSIIKVYFKSGECYLYLPGNKWIKHP